MTTAQELVVQQLLDEFYHTAVSNRPGRPEARAAQLKTHVANMNGVRAVAQARLNQLEEFATLFGGDMQKRCAISAHHLACLRQALS